jgi:putative transposase
MKASVEHVQQQFALSERRSCRLLLVPVSSYRYQPRDSNQVLRDRLVELAREKPRYGYRRLHVLLGREGEQVNHKRVHRPGATPQEAQALRAPEHAAGNLYSGQP